MAEIEIVIKPFNWEEQGGYWYDAKNGIGGKIMIFDVYESRN